jgi:hypothetical protein
MTLADVEAATGVPADHVIAELGLPRSVEHDERLGRLRRTYGFNISDVRRVVQTYQVQNAQPRRD